MIVIFEARSDAILSRSIPHNGVPGASLLALTREGTVVYSGLAGTLGMDDKRPINDGTVSLNLGGISSQINSSNRGVISGLLSVIVHQRFNRDVRDGLH